MEYIVGRKGTQPFAIDDLTVSREHCRITDLGDGTYRVENLSKTGATYVNGRDILSTTATRDAQVRLGDHCTFCLRDLFPEREVPQEKEKEDYTKEFKKLKAVYEKYERDTLALQQEQGRRTFMRFLPMLISMALTAASKLVPGAGDVLFKVIGALTLVIIAYTFVTMRKGVKDDPARRNEINKQFQIDYVCPKCKHFLGYTPYENLVQRKHCDYCKAIWVK